MQELAHLGSAACNGVDRLDVDRPVIALDKALAWARGEIRIEVRLPNGSIEEMNVMQYRRECETQERLRAHRGTSAPGPGLPPPMRGP